MQIQWTQRLTIGLSSIDEQHKELIARVNNLLAALERGEKAETVRATLKFLEDYVIEHFGNEERLMLDGWYPEYLQHRKQHTAFVESLGELKAQFEANGPSVGLAMALHGWLSRWITGHINSSDRALCAYLQGPQCQAPAVAPSMPEPPQTDNPGATTTAALRGRLLGQVLVQMGKLTLEQAAQAAEAAHANKEQFGRYLMRNGLVSPADVCQALAAQSGLKTADPALLEAPEHGLFPALMMLRHYFVPFKQLPESICVATNHPLSLRAQQELEKHCGKRIAVFLAPDDKMAQVLAELQPRKTEQARREVRYEVALPVNYVFCDRQGKALWDESFVGATVNIGEGNLTLEGPAAPQGSPEELRGRQGCLKIHFALQPHAVDAVVLIRGILPRAAGAPATWIYDAEFLALTPEQRNQLRQLCIRVGLWQGRHPGQMYPAR